MARPKRPVPTPAWVKPEAKQKRELHGKHEGPKNGHAKPAKYDPAKDDEYDNPNVGG